MRRPLPFELSVLARHLATLPAPDRPAVARRLLIEAEAAAGLFAATGQPHPRHGDGSLIGRLMALPLPPEPFADQPDYLHALQIAAAALLQHNAGKAALAGGKAGADHGRNPPAHYAP